MGIKYPQAIFEKTLVGGSLLPQVAEIAFTTFSSKAKGEQVASRLVVRRIPELNATKLVAAHSQLFTTYWYHVFFTTVKNPSWRRWPQIRSTANTRSSSRCLQT
ncbi:hypothetical protein GCM10009720_09950 [Yaniella flava]|uniref:Uncharacterized protein n=1 Tax=Yaniella flava TaxID=287930 RepID=A0ABN2U9D9_9MICC